MKYKIKRFSKINDLRKTIKKISEKPNLSRPDTSAIKKKAKELKKLTGNALIDYGDGIEKVLVHTRGPIKIQE